MKSTFKYMAAAPMEMKGNNEIENMVKITLSVGENGDVNLCFIDSVKSNEDLYSRQFNENTYPNQGDLLYSKHGLWLSLFTRHMEDISIEEIEIEE